MTRQIITVPTMHTGDEASHLMELFDLMSPSQESLEAYEQAGGPYWKALRESLLGLDLDFSKVKVYSEGLLAHDVSQLWDYLKTNPKYEPVFRKGESVKSKDDARNLYESIPFEGDLEQTRMIIYLMARGAKIMPCEDEDLYGKMREALEKFKDAMRFTEEELDEDITREDLLNIRKFALDFDIVTTERDHYLGEAINETLHDDEIGITIWGTIHDASPYLDADIKVSNLPNIPDIRKELGMPVASYESVKLITDLAAETMGFEPLDDFRHGSPESKG